MDAERRPSIVITNYNYGRFLPEAIDSALVQQERPEIVVVDDGSTDCSQEVIARYQHVIRAVSKENGGMASALNAGFAASRGDPVVFLDADDVLLPSALHTVVPLFESDDVVRVQFRMREVDEHGQPTGRLVPATELDEGRYLREALLRDGPLATPTVGGASAWSRQFLREAFPVPEPDFSRHCDTYLSTIAPLAGTTRVVREPQALYRVHGGNDYAGQPRCVQNRRNLELYVRRCTLLAERLHALGSRARADDWMGDNAHHAWLRELDEGCRALAGAIPEGAIFLLIDEDHWASGAQLLPKRRSIAFPHRNGVYWGPPSDDDAAVAELERAWEEGVTYVVFARPAFWWLEHYPALRETLEHKLRRVVESERTVVYGPR